MPLPLVIAALAAGGTLVPHAAGGFIVSSSGGYVAGTYFGTSAVASLFAAGGALATGAAVLTGAASAVIGSAGLFGTSYGATGITGVLMSAGIISSTPVWVPILTGGTAIGVTGTAGYFAYHLSQIRRKAKAAGDSEVHFSERQAKVLQRLLVRVT